MKKTLIALSLAASLVAGSAIAMPGSSGGSTTRPQPLVTLQDKAEVRTVQQAVATLTNLNVPVIGFTATNGGATTATTNAQNFLTTYYNLSSTQLETSGLIATISSGDAHISLSVLAGIIGGRNS